ncbi:MAG TPA: fumarylacetoacetate hydrolase family protein [Xanthobacteraceae bacterium]|nr:fumarylacetoacetate hydrolase family protein [Xanthobacteraceae bacterium]
MRIFAYKTPDGPKAGVEKDGKIFGLAEDYSWADAVPVLHKYGAKAALMDRPLSAPRATVPATIASKILCVGVNYHEHAAEGKMPPPEFPNFFVRYISSLVANDEPILLPRVSTKLDFEAELVIIIGKGGRYIPREQALDHVLGYTTGMDGSVRDYQKRTSQFTLGKNFDRSGALGPYIVTPEELPAGAKGLKVQSRVNGQLMQDGNTAEMIFDTAAIVSAASEAITLQPGDVIFTGTPSGVGFARKPPVFLKDGDKVEVSVENVGTLKNQVAAE